MRAEISDIEMRGLSFAFKIGAFVKMDCGHWQFLQLPYVEQDDEVALTKM